MSKVGPILGLIGSIMLLVSGIIIAALENGNAFTNESSIWTILPWIVIGLN